MNSKTPEALPSFFKRLPVAFGAFFRVLANPGFAARVIALSQSPAVATEPEAAAVTPVAPAPLTQASPDGALQLLGMLQREARLIDFIQEDLGAYSDADVGGVARVLHEGCRKVLREHFTLAPLRAEAEGSRITLNAGFDARALRLTGNVVGQPPFSGSLVHRGWRATETRLPKLAEGHDVSVLAQAEVEL